MNQEEFMTDIYDITSDKIDSIVMKIIKNSILNSDFLISSFCTEVIKCSSYRPEKINELANLFLKIGLNFKDQSQIIDKMKFSLLSIAFRTYQNDINIEEKTFIMGFLYKLYEISFFDDFSLIFDIFQQVTTKENEFFHNFQFLFLIWFLPEIENDHLSFLNEKLNELSKFVKSSDCSTLFFSIESMIEHLRKDNCKVIKQIRSNCYNYNFYINRSKYLKSDTDDIEVKICENNEKVEPSIFITCPFLQYRPTASMIDAFFRSQRFDIKKGEYDFTMIDDNDNRFTYFIAASGSIENIQYVQQFESKINLNGTLHISALFHRNDLFEFLFNSLKSADEQTSALTEKVWRLGTVLHQAAISDNIKIFDFYVSKGIEISRLTDDEGRSIIHHAAQYNSIQIINKIEKFFFSSLNCPIEIDLGNSSFKSFSSFVNSTDDNGITPLMYASMNNSIEAVQVFLRISQFYKLVIDVNSRDITGRTALHYAAKTGATQIVIELLNFNGISPDPLDNALRLPSHFASHYGHPAALEALVMNDSSADRKSKNGWTPLKFAIACGHKKCVSLLLNHLELTKEEKEDLFKFSEERERHEISKLILK